MTYSAAALTKIAEDWLKENFDLPLHIPVKINPRMKSTLGWFKSITVFGGVQRPVEIEISKKLLMYYPDEVILDVLYHELIHYALFTLKKPHRDGDRFFEETLKIFGVARTHTYQHHGKVHEYKCACKVHTGTKKLDLGKAYKCKKCGSQLTYLGEKIV